MAHPMYSFTKYIYPYFALVALKPSRHVFMSSLSPRSRNTSYGFVRNTAIVTRTIRMHLSLGVTSTFDLCTGCSLGSDLILGKYIGRLEVLLGCLFDSPVGLFVEHDQIKHLCEKLILTFLFLFSSIW